MPETVAGIGGRHFLQVKLGVPSELTEQRERLGIMMDEMSSGKSAVPDSIEFIQQAVGKLAATSS